MLGTILFIDDGTETAILRADDGKRYRFALSDWPASAAPLAIGTKVDFDPDGDNAVGPLPASAMEPNTDRPPAITEANQPAPGEPLLQRADNPEQAAGPSLNNRPLNAEVDSMPDYAGLSQPTVSGVDGTMRALIVGGGVVLLLTLAALAYMMWDNAAGSGDMAEVSDAVTLYAQDDLPVRNVASMTNSTVLGRIQRGDRVSGVEVPGSSDPNSRWLQMDGGNRFVPMTGLATSAPSAAPDPTPLPVPTPVPTPVPNDGSLDGNPGSGSSSGGFAPDILDDRPTPAPPPPVRPTPPPAPRPAPRPPAPSPEPRGDPRDTPPVQ